jgi:hypothetical protein
MEMKNINKRRMLGAAISEYLPILGLIATILIGGVAQYGNEARKQSARMSSELAGIDAPLVASNGGHTPGHGGGGITGGGQNNYTSPPASNNQGGTGSSDSPDSSQVVEPVDGAGQQIDPVNGQPVTDDVVSGDGDVIDENTNPNAGQNTSSVLEQVARFIEGAANGLKSQVVGMIKMLLNPVETFNGLKELAIALVTEPEETLKVLLEVFKEDLEKLTSGDPYKIGEVIGENVSPATLLAIVNKLRKIDKIANSPRRQGAAKDVDTACSSFLAGTPVWAENGMVAIETLNVGDRVHARSDESFADEPQRISHLLRRDVTHYYELDTSYEVIRTTEEHPFWLQGKGWTPASQLKAGDVLARADGDIQIHKMRLVQGPASVYNFTVEKTHTYFVGKNKLWVHNANIVCDVKTARLEAIRERIPPYLQRKFDDDLKDNQTLEDALVDNPNLADSWVVVAGHEQIRKDLPTLNKLDSLMKDKDVMDVLGEQGLKDIMENVVNPIDGRSSSLVSLTRHLDNIQTFVKNHKNVPGFDATIRDLKSTPYNMQKGVTHALEVMRVYPEGSIKKMDMTFEIDGGPCTKCRFDLELDPSKSGGVVYVEFKSYKLESIPHLPINQLKTYFSAAKSISEMKYVFNKLDTPNLSDVKKQMQNVFQKNANDIFSSMTPEMRRSLGVDDLLDGKSAFDELVNDVNSDLYKFIEIR